MLLQELINNVEVPVPAKTYDEAVQKQHEALLNYRNHVLSMPLNISDRKKLLSLPFYLTKRREIPEPKPGQNEWDIFEKMYGKRWNHYDGIEHDLERKITEFNYEKFIHPTILAHEDTESEEFKNKIRKMNFFSKTEYEQHLENQETFRNLMPFLAQLNHKEQWDLIHYI